MTTQFKMFPKTELDEATLVLNHLIAEEEKAEKALDSAEQKSADASMQVRKQRHVVAKLQAMMPAAEPTVTDDVEEAEFLQIEGDVLDPITGEVTSKDQREEGDHWTCPDCHGDGRGDGAHKCKACDGTGHRPPSCDNCTVYSDCNISQPFGSATMGCGGASWLHGEKVTGSNTTPVVVVLYPGDDDPHVTEVGPLTRYSELVADYLTYTGIDAEVDADEWQVLAERELTSETGGMRHLYDLIRSVDYGHRLIVAAADQGSVTGTPVESEAVA